MVLWGGWYNRNYSTGLQARPNKNISLQIHKYTNTSVGKAKQKYIFTNTQIHKYTNTSAGKAKKIHLYKYTKYTNTSAGKAKQKYIFTNTFFNYTLLNLWTYIFDDK